MTITRLRPTHALPAKADGKFLLYSIGWNEKDDGGQIVRNKSGAVDVSSPEGDWVWPVPK